MASVSDTRYKQQAVIEFLVAEKESVENIHKRLCAVYGSCAVDRSTAGRWVQRVKASKVEKRICMINRGLNVLPQPRAQTCCSAPMTLFMRIGASQVGNWPYSFQSALEVQWQLLTLWDFRKCAQDGFLEVSQPSTDVKGKPSVLNCWSILMLRGRPFCP